ncbi:hypothetical protein ROTAS13_01869 [Roseomonas sp. TAS13]|uniref:hypothetical protein n=1 Tax=Roseomonas TaxID=125216 RepID=UPI00095AA00F|nr:MULTISPECIES: hypothetical protein [Roseomonas]MCG7352630.1 hypothetical protein [Roseomonas mucosa]MCG7358268.1 hypothetical protein [Roseomonas mucosa]GAV34206.1 hypothetical protein ROTAS13_01869 [Roseomonas sp. TAS13]
MSEKLTPTSVAAEELRSLAEDLEQAAWRMDINPEDPLGIWSIAMRHTVIGMANLVERQERGVESIIKRSQALVDKEVTALRAMGDTAALQIGEAQAALAKAKVDAEKLTLQTLHDLTPKIVEQIRDAVVIREKRYNRSMRWRHYALISAATVCLMVGGYSVRAWQDLGATSAMARCVSAGFKAADGEEYCAMRTLLPPAPARPSPSG